MKYFTTLVTTALVAVTCCHGEIFSTTPFNPTKVAGLALWLDASDTSTLYDSDVGGNLSTNNGAVGRWEDKSGNGNNFTNGVSATQPFRYDVGTINKTMVRSEQDYLTSLRFLTSKTVFVVNTINQFVSLAPIYGDALGDKQIRQSTSSGTWFGGNAQDLYFGGSVYLNGILNKRDYTIGVRHILTSVASPSATFATRLYRIFADVTNNRLSRSNLGELIVFDRILTDAERIQVENYLSAKWSMPLNGKVSSEDYPVQPAIVVTTAQSQPVVDDASLTNGLVLWYKMDESKWAESASDVLDSSGSGNHGTSYNGVQTNPGKLNRAGYFDGVNDKIRAVAENGTDFSTNDFSVSFWIKTRDVEPSWATVVAKGNPIVAVPSYGVFCTTNTVIFRIRDAVNFIGKTSVSFPVGLWTHITAIRYDVGGVDYISLHVNGVMSGTPASTTKCNISTTTKTEVGYTQNFFNGQLDDVRIYNRALTSNEVSRLYAMTSVDHKANAVYQGNKLVSNATKLSYLSETPNYANSIVFKTAGYSNTWTAPYITASTLNNSDVSWRRLSDGAVTYTKTPSMTFFNKTNDTYWVTSSDWSKVTAFSFSSSSGIKPFLFSIYTSMLSPRLTGLSTIRFDFQGLDVDYQVEPLPISLSGTGLEYTWQYCTGSKNSFPCISNLINVISLRNTWGACYGNTNEFPYVNSLTNVISLREAWYNCYGIKNGFPAVSNLVKITTLENAWKACYGNTNEFPYVNSLTNVTGSGLVGTWQDCSGIKNRFPAVSNLTNVTSLVNTWASCYGNTNEFPYVNSLTNVVSLVSAWGTCQGIKNGFPAVSNLVKVTTIASAWSGCTGNTNEFPYVNSLTNISAGGLASAWYNCNSIKNGFPDVSNLVKVNDLSRTWAYCRNLTNGLPYINSLTNTLVMFQTYFEVSEYRLDFPEVSALTKVFSLGNTWYGCRTSSCFPSVTTLTNVAGNLQYTAMDATWYDCRAMTNNIAQLVQPLSYFSSGKCKYFGKTFYNCYNLKGSAMPYITAIQSAPSYPTGYTTTQMFYNCTNLTDYASIPAGFK